MKERITSHFIDDIIKAIESIEQFVEGLTLEQFQNDLKTLRAVERELEIIGEAVKKLPSELTEKHPSIPWKAIAGMRDRLIHHYWDTEIDILWATIQESLPPFKEVMIQINKHYR